MTRKVVLAFDLYGTLVDTSAISTVFRSCPTKDPETFAAKVTSAWRTLQLEYTWRLNSMEKYAPMSEVTRCSLRHALKAEGVKSPLLEELEVKAMGKYDELRVFPDAAKFLHQLPAISASLQDRGIDLQCLIFSNGTPRMVEAAISSSELLSATFVKDGDKNFISVDDIKVFKPSPKTYRYVLEKLGKDTGKDVFLVSGNPFDIAGAKNAGLGTIWVDRSVDGSGWTDGLLGEEDKGPEHVLKGLDNLESIFNQI